MHIAYVKLVNPYGAVDAKQYIVIALYKLDPLWTSHWSRVRASVPSSVSPAASHWQSQWQFVSHCGRLVSPHSPCPDCSVQCRPWVCNWYPRGISVGGSLGHRYLSVLHYIDYRAVHLVTVSYMVVKWETWWWIDDPGWVD